MFFNTIDLKSPELDQQELNTIAQEELILSIYKINNKEISPSQILKIINEKYHKNWPLTSIRRSVTNLTKENLLVKMPNKVKGIYGLPEHVWRLKQKSEQQKLF